MSAADARTDRYAEAINHTAVTDSAELLRDIIDAVMAVADAELAAAVSEAQADADSLGDALAREVAEVQRLEAGIRVLASEWWPADVPGMGTADCANELRALLTEGSE